MKRILIILLSLVSINSFASDNKRTEQEALSKSRVHWDAFYANKHVSLSPTPFAVDCLPVISKGKPLLELGCGNGRDAAYFGNHGIEVYACDLSSVSIAKLKENTSNPNIHFFTADFTNLGESLDPIELGTVYSRFTLHSIPEEKAKQVYHWVYEHLAPGGKFLIEARSTRDSLYGQGANVNKNAYFTDHYRRFLILDDVVKDLKMIGFKIEKAIESRGLAKYKNQDPPVIRIIAQKR